MMDGKFCDLKFLGICKPRRNPEDSLEIKILWFGQMIKLKSIHHEYLFLARNLPSKVRELFQERKGFLSI